MKQRYAFYVTNEATRLCKFLSRYGNNMKQIVLIITEDCPGERLKLLADKNKIKILSISYNSLIGTKKEKNLTLSNYIFDKLIKYKIDYLFSFGSHILCGNILEVFKNRIINFHPSILPMFPGSESLDQAIKYGNTLVVGNTAHFIDEGVDTGKIIMQSVTTIKPLLETNNYDVILDMQVEMLNKLMKIIYENRLIEKDGYVEILGANYNKHIIYPDV